MSWTQCLGGGLFFFIGEVGNWSCTVVPPTLLTTLAVLAAVTQASVETNGKRQSLPLCPPECCAAWERTQP